MSERIVVDASAALPLLVQEAGSARVWANVRRWREGDATLTVPSHFWLEITNTLMVRRRRTGQMVIEALRELDEVGIETVEIDRPLLLAALDLAERHMLTTYDAAYLALAETLGASIYSADRALLAAAADRGIAVDSDRTAEAHASYERTPTWPRYREAAAYLSKLRAEASAR